MRAGYKRAFLQCLLLLCVGVILQIFFGGVPVSALAYPWGVVVALVYGYLLVLGYVLARKAQWLRSLFDARASVATLTSMMLLCIIFGLVPQTHSSAGFLGALGFTDMSHSYPFCLMLAYFITCLGFKTIDDVCHWREQRLTTLLLHVSVFVALAASFLSSGDKLRLKVVVPVGHTVHVGYDADNSPVELPFTLTLDEFSLESYAPRLALYDLRGEGVSESNLSLEDMSCGAIDGFDIAVEHFLSDAVPSADGFVESAEEGSAPAARVAVHTPWGDVVHGWVSSGSFRFEPQSLGVTPHVALVMLPQEPKHYLSRLTITEQGGVATSHDVAVNSPARVGAWHIYQSGYDTERGRWSRISVLECVRDGWYGVVGGALWAILLSGCLMFLRPMSKTSEE